MALIPPASNTFSVEEIRDHVVQHINSLENATEHLPEDVLEVSPLTTNAILNVCKRRALGGSLFTMASSEVLVAMNMCNPPKDGIFSPAVMSRFIPTALAPSSEPHIFGSVLGVWRRAWTAEAPKPQLVLLTGDSASGKSELFKQAWRCLVQLQFPRTASGPAPSNPTSMDADRAVEDATLLLACFTDVPTQLHGDSSRSAKVLTLRFLREGGALSGCKVQAPALSVVDGLGTFSQDYPSYTKWFRIFHHMILGSNAQQRMEYKFDSEAFSSPIPDMQGSTFSPFSPEEHSAAFSRVHEAMGRLNIPLLTRTAMFKFMAGLLHLSHLRLGGDESVSVEQPRALPVIEELLGIKEETLEVALCKQEKKFGKEVEIMAISRKDAVASQRSLVRTLYGGLVDFMLESVNAFLAATFGAVTELALSSVASVTVVDGFGAETTTRANLDKFCRNYAAEKLHRVFVKKFFSDLMTEVIMEGIPISVVESAEFSTENDELVDAFEADHDGLLAAIQAQTVLQKPSPSTFINDLAGRLNNAAYL